MKRVKTADLTGAALDWAVAKALGIRTYIGRYEHTLTGPCILDADLVDMQTDGEQELKHSRSWAQGGPLVDVMIETHGLVFACRGKTVVCSLPFSIEHQEWFGATPLIAAMRCFATKALGAEVDVPEELL